MRKKLTFLMLAALFITATGFSQNGSKNFAIGVYASITNFQGSDAGGFYKEGNINRYIGPNVFSFTNFAYNIVEPLNLATSLSLYKKNEDNAYLNDNYMWKWDLGLQLRFMPLLDNDEAILDPYLYVNGGIFEQEKKVSPVVNGGLGLNIWVHENFAFVAQSGYNYAFSNESFLETTFGVKIRFGKGTDTDGDGIVDSKDLCPNEPGVKSAEGCPDADGDGIADANDKCPNDFGTPENDGCPVLDEERKAKVIQDLIFAAKNIQFETGSANIKSESHENLDNVVKILKLFPSLNLSIDGYTDNTGDPEFNKKLSQDRADAVKQHFINKGIESSRLTSTGHGQENPIASNDTPEGKAKNRRVELTIED